MRLSTFEYSIGSIEFYEKLVHCLKTIRQVLDEYSICYWLDLGTLLGAVRDGQILPWDDDVDVGIWIKDYPLLSMASNRFKELGYILYVNPNHGHYQLACRNTGEHLACLLAYSNIQGFTAKLHFIPLVRLLSILNNVDTNISNRVKEFTWRIIVKLRLYNDDFVVSPSTVIGMLNNCNIYNMDFSIPESSEYYLHWMYGDTWNEIRRRDDKVKDKKKKRLKIKELMCQLR